MLKSFKSKPTLNLPDLLTLKKILTAATACVLCAQAGVWAQAPVPTEASAEDVTDVVAVFLASNLRQGIDGAISQLESYGLQLDRARLDSMLMVRLAQPYNEDLHRQAAQVVSQLVAEASARQSDSFMAQAAAQPGAVTLPSGVVIETITEGSGAIPTAESTVTIRYTGVLPDGTVFDEMSPDDDPMRTRVADLAPGLTEALTHTPAGGRYSVTIPAELAYGSEGVPGVIPPNTPLRFIIDLLECVNF